MPYFIDVDTQGAAIEVWLNDCAVARFEAGEDGGPGRGAATLEGYVLPGANSLKVVVDPGPTPSRALEPHAPVAASAKGRVRVFCPASWDFNPDREPVVTQVSWDDPAVVAAPRVAATGFVAPESRAVPLWWHATPRAPDAALVTLMTAVQAALNNGDVATLVAVQQEAMVASQLATDDDLVTRQQNLAAFLAEVLPGKPVSPYVPQAEWDLRSFSQGRLIDLIARDWRPIVRRGDANAMTAIELRVGIIGGQWQVLL